MDPVTVNISFRLDANAIQSAGDVKTWARILRIEGLAEVITWDMVYEELTKILAGAEHYKSFSKTAIGDCEAFGRFVLRSEVSIIPQVVAPATKTKLQVVPPPPPPPNGKTPVKA